MERDDEENKILYFLRNFNSRAHVERDAISDIEQYMANNFNSRAHVERDAIGEEFKAIPQEISTHALTWSATSFYIYSKTMERISTHALTWSATLEESHSKSLSKNFNSRAHVERDTESNTEAQKGEAFQLTRSRGARPVKQTTTKTRKDFNSRAHVERDPTAEQMRAKELDISTHALTWSATHDICQLDSVRIFQLTRSRGARLLETITNTDVSEISTHALTWSATMKR